MKEITRVATLQVTEVMKVEDAVADAVATQMKEQKPLLADWVKAKLNADDVVAKDVKVFMMEVDDEGTNS